ncbi:hypothetical protein Ndes2526A_g06164 [Nannochloris sp. 'desiccata']
MAPTPKPLSAAQQKRADAAAAKAAEAAAAEAAAAAEKEAAEKEESEILMFDPIPLPALPVAMRRELPSDAEIVQLDSLVKRAELRSLGEAYTALGTAQQVTNMLTTGDHPPEAFQETLSAQLAIAIPVVQEQIRNLIVLGTHGQKVARNLQANRVPNRFGHDSDYAAALDKALKDAAKAQPSKRPRSQSNWRGGSSGARGSGSGQHRPAQTEQAATPEGVTYTLFIVSLSELPALLEDEPDFPAEFSHPSDQPLPPPPPGNPQLNHALRNKLPFWQKVCRSKTVLHWIEHGVAWTWASEAPPEPWSEPNHPPTAEHAEFVSSAVAALLLSGAITPVAERPTIVSPLNVIPRRGKNRLIVDLRHVNKHIIPDKADHPYKFRFEGVADAPTVLQPGDQMFTVDLESAYHHIDIHPAFWQFLGFYWQGQYYVFRSLPFGLCIAPWVFTKVTRVLVQHWRSRGRRLLHYLDDFLFAIHPSALIPFGLVQRRVLRDIQDAGFSLSIPKLKLAPAVVQQFLGFVFNTQWNTIQVSPVRVTEFMSQLAIVQHKKAPRGSELARLLGQLASMTVVLGTATRAYTRACYVLLSNYRDLSHHWRHTVDSRAELEFWSRRFHEFNSTPIWRSTSVTTMEIFSDASDFGWGGHGLLRGDELEAQGYFEPWEQGPATSSTLRETFALDRVFTSLARALRCVASSSTSPTAVRAYVDNLGLTYIMLKGSRVPAINFVVKQIFEFCWQHNIELTVQWVPRCLNERADILSKLHDGDDWMLNPKFFHIFDSHPEWGPHTVDIFASELNHHCDQFYSLYHCPSTSGVDAFAHNWAGENCWINPPFGAIGKVIRHLRQCKAVATMICPQWPGRPWWPLLQPDGKPWASFVVNHCELPTVPDLFLPGPKHSNKHAVGSPHWKVLALRLDFRNLK